MTNLIIECWFKIFFYQQMLFCNKVLWNSGWGQTSPFVMARMKLNCKKSTKVLVDELQGIFPNYELMLALGVIYSNFWAKKLDNARDDFHQCLIVYYIFTRWKNMGCEWKLYLIALV